MCKCVELEIISLHSFGMPGFADYQRKARSCNFSVKNVLYLFELSCLIKLVAIVRSERTKSVSRASERNNRDEEYKSKLCM